MARGVTDTAQQAAKHRTKKELTQTAKALNARSPRVRTSGTKAVILNSIKQHESRLQNQPKPAKTWDEAHASIFGKKKKKKKKKPKEAEKPKASAAFGGGGSMGTEGQKNEARRLRKLEKRVRRAGDKDMASELAF